MLALLLRNFFREMLLRDVSRKFLVIRYIYSYQLYHGNRHDVGIIIYPPFCLLQQHHEALFPPPSPLSGERLGEAVLALLAYESWQNHRANEKGKYESAVFDDY